MVFQHFHFDTVVKCPFAVELVGLVLLEASSLEWKHLSMINLPSDVQDWKEEAVES